jgi:hypothetical protein
MIKKENIMQTWITDKDFYKSAVNLNRQHLQANLYESIHILASLLDVNDKLVNPKRNVKNHPAAKLWEGYEDALFYYIDAHIVAWLNIGYKCNINKANMRFIYAVMKDNKYSYFQNKISNWITDELIQTHRSVLIQKEIKKKVNHYQNLWPNCPNDLKMKYDWRRNK